MMQATEVYIVRHGSAGEIVAICLGLKREGSLYVPNRLVSAGGRVTYMVPDHGVFPLMDYVGDDSLHRQVAVDRLGAELGVQTQPECLTLAAELTLLFPHDGGEDVERRRDDLHVMVYLVDKDRCQGEPTKSDQITRPAWYAPTELVRGEAVYRLLPEADQRWLPMVLAGKFITAIYDVGNHGEFKNEERYTAKPGLALA